MVTVEYNGKTTVATTASVEDSAPAVFTMTGSGKGQAIAANADGSLNSPSNPEAKGSVVRLYATGLGQTVPAGVDGQFAVSASVKPAMPVVVLIGGFVAEDSQVTVPAGFFAGLMEIAIKIPDEVPSGEATTVAIAVGGLLGPATATLALR